MPEPLKIGDAVYMTSRGPRRPARTYTVVELDERSPQRVRCTVDPPLADAKGRGPYWFSTAYLYQGTRRA